MRLSRVARETIDLARSGSLGREFPTWDDMVKEAEGDYRKLARLISLNYGRRISERDIRIYAGIYDVDISSN